MKILYVINSLEIGGAQRLLADMLKSMARDRNIETGVITFQSSKDSGIYRKVKENSKIKFYDLSERKLSLYRLIRAIRNISKDYDLIHAHLFPAGYLATLANGRRKPVIYTEHSTHNRRREKRYLRKVERFFYNRFASIVAISDSVKENLNHWLESSAIDNKTIVIPNGIDIEMFRNAAKGTLQKITGTDKKIIIMVSRFTAAKDQATLIRALKHLEDTDIIAVFVGEGETLDGCKELAVTEGVEDRVFFLGPRDDIPSLLTDSIIGVQSSNWEGFGLAVIEMMASGLPVISSNVSGLADVVSGSGILFKRGDDEELAKVINDLINDEMALQHYHKLSEARASEYDINATCDAHKNLYRKIIAIKRTNKPSSK